MRQRSRESGAGFIHQSPTKGYRHKRSTSGNRSDRVGAHQAIAGQSFLEIAFCRQHKKISRSLPPPKNREKPVDQFQTLSPFALML
jgi:hypothetical protein